MTACTLSDDLLHTALGGMQSWEHKPSVTLVCPILTRSPAPLVQLYPGNHVTTQPRKASPVCRLTVSNASARYMTHHPPSTNTTSGIGIIATDTSNEPNTPEPSTHRNCTYRALVSSRTYPLNAPKHTDWLLPDTVIVSVGGSGNVCLADVLRLPVLRCLPSIACRTLRSNAHLYHYIYIYFLFICKVHFCYFAHTYSYIVYT